MRKFPNPNLDTLKSFVISTNAIERIPMNISIVNKAIKDGKENGDPYAVGHFSAINLILKKYANEDNLIPKSNTIITENHSHERFQWLRDVHTEIMTPIMIQGEKLLQPDAPLKHQIGSYRSLKKTLGRRSMPDPSLIKKHMHDLLLSLARFNEEIDIKIKNPFMLSKMDIKSIADTCYDAHLKICCIKPFHDGSNRVARLFENAIRLYWGLPWKVYDIENKDKYMADIFSMQEKYPEYIKN